MRYPAWFDSMNFELHEPQTAVVGFAKKHTELVVEFWKRNRDTTNPNLQKLHDDLVANYLTNRKRVHFQFRLFVASAPPVYQHVTEENIKSVEFKNSRRAYVDIIEFRVRQFRFVVLKKTDGWRIDSLKSLRHDGEWVPSPIGV